jgi:hypothetical protein
MAMCMTKTLLLDTSEMILDIFGGAKKKLDIFGFRINQMPVGVYRPSIQQLSIL